METEKEMVLEPSLKESMEVELLKMQAEKAAMTKITSAVPSAWKMSEKGLEAVRKGVQMYQTEYGLYASIPMICKGEECVYAEMFPELHAGLSEAGERCPVEVALIISKYNAYIQELDISPDDAVDLSILRDVIDYDVQIMRAENKMAIEGDFVKDVVVGVNDAGIPVTQEQISQAANYKSAIQLKRNKALELLNSTRKDKAGTKLTMVMDPSTYARDLLVQNKEVSIVGEFEALDIIPDTHGWDKK